MRVIGLTGVIGTGKSEVARLLRRLGAKVHDADATVHKLYRDARVQKRILAEFPLARSFWTWRLDRKKLMRSLRGDAVKKQKLEAIIHPLVQADRAAFLHKNRGAKLVVLDIPLLYEVGADALCDEVWVTHCRPELQRKRVLKRPGFTPEKLDAILQWQGDGRWKRQMADRALNTGTSRARLLQTIKKWIQ